MLLDWNINIKVQVCVWLGYHVEQVWTKKRYLWVALFTLGSRTFQGPVPFVHHDSSIIIGKYISERSSVKQTSQSCFWKWNKWSNGSDHRENGKKKPWLRGAPGALGPFFFFLRSWELLKKFVIGVESLYNVVFVNQLFVHIYLLFVGFPPHSSQSVEYSSPSYTVGSH